MFRRDTDTYTVNSKMPFESYAFVNNKLYRVDRISMQRVHWPEVEALFHDEKTSHVIPLCHNLNRYLTVSNDGELVNMVVVHHFNRSHVVRHFHVDIIIRDLVISLCGRVFRIEPSKKIPLQELRMKIPKGISEIHEVYDECFAVLGSHSWRGPVWLTFVRSNQIIADECDLKGLTRDMKDRRSAKFRGRYCYLSNNQITAYTIRQDPEPVVEANIICTVDARHSRLVDFVQMYNGGSALLLVVERNGVQQVDRLDRASTTWIRLDIIDPSNDQNGDERHESSEHIADVIDRQKDENEDGGRRGTPKILRTLHDCTSRADKLARPTHSHVHL